MQVLSSSWRCAKRTRAAQAMPLVGSVNPATGLTLVMLDRPLRQSEPTRRTAIRADGGINRAVVEAPRPSMNRITNRPTTDTVFTRQLAHGHDVGSIALANLRDLLSRQDSLRSRLASCEAFWMTSRAVPVTTGAASLCRHIAHIVMLIANEQVGWIAARWGISVWTVVQDVQAPWDWTERQFPGQAMSEHFSPTSGTSTDPKRTIAARQAWACPQPTAITDGDTSPKGSDLCARILGLHPVPPDVGATTGAVGAAPGHIMCWSILP
jgi:hypothetical protein